MSVGVLAPASHLQNVLFSASEIQSHGLHRAVLRPLGRGEPSREDPEDEESQVYKIIYYLCSLVSQVYQLLLNAVFLKYLMLNRKLRRTWKKRETS